ncbi:hypothetical protein AciPR4_3913 [Terriglobus saanensis SP1PR4]|uniref:Uncharacterized protein n=2 Tax=Terriglobus saanensis TaxID=870903 RepID=E8V2W5_TERSS|nr:hypothetical protein AciPR4_3913 [Terriglobus saanensis SP1PR4]
MLFLFWEDLRKCAKSRLWGASTRDKFLRAIILGMPRHLFLVLLAFVHVVAGAQTAPDPTLDEVLARLDQNRIAYYQSVPNFFCNEHVVSEMDMGDTRGFMRTVTDSVFRLRRTVVKRVANFEESRSVKAINGRALSGEEQKIQGPSILSGVFGSGLEAVSTPSEACFNYKLKTHRSHGELERIEVDFADLPKEERGPDCPQFEQVSGKATIDPVSMEVIRVERHIREHQLFPGVLGPWTWSAEYGQVLLGDKLFWMPVKIRSKARQDTSAEMSSSGIARREGSATIVGNGHTTWSFVATYTDFHRTQVSAHIVAPMTKEATPEAKPDPPKP